MLATATVVSILAELVTMLALQTLKTCTKQAAVCGTKMRQYKQFDLEDPTPTQPAY